MFPRISHTRKLRLQTRHLHEGDLERRVWARVGVGRRASASVAEVTEEQERDTGHHHGQTHADGQLRGGKSQHKVKLRVAGMGKGTAIDFRILLIIVSTAPICSFQPIHKTKRQHLDDH